MPLTRIESKAALKHVVVTVLYQRDDGPLMQSLTNEGIDNINDLMLLESDMAQVPCSRWDSFRYQSRSARTTDSLLCLR
jgi:hypothetical protein